MDKDLAVLLPELVEAALPLSKISGLSSDTRGLKPGEIFIALRGEKNHGLDFAAAALDGGASLVLSEDPLPEALKARALHLADLRQRLPGLLNHFYQPQPQTLVAVTGTNGKTSVADFLRQIWQRQGQSAASLGTLGFNLNGELKPTGGLTSGDLINNHKRLHHAQAAGVTHLALEASSHGLDQGRLAGLNFQALGFTNLSRDHLDYHSDMESYFSAKKKLFQTPLAEGASFVINRNDPYGERLFQEVGLGRDGYDFGPPGSRLVLRACRPDTKGQSLQIQIDGVDLAIQLPLIGSFQVENALIALGLALASGAEIDQAAEALAQLKGVNGRLELVLTLKNDAPIYVDYAHTPEALASALRQMRPYTKDKLAVLFGAGGDRDPGKREMMGQMAASLADRVYVTDDNPRTEDPASIRASILKGATKAVEIPDRRQAIRAALEDLKTGDLLLVAGKGHESGQTIGNKVLPFLDAEVVRKEAEDLGLCPA